MSDLQVVLVGAGSFGRNHARAISALAGVRLAGVFDAEPDRAANLAAQFGSRVITDWDALRGEADCAIVATPTSTHEDVAQRLLESALDVLVEKPIAHTAEAGARLAEIARARGRILQVGHLERFNPAVRAMQQHLTVPLFFEVHRLSVFSPRSLDVDVVLDLMIHDLDIVLTSTKESPSEIRAAGISVLSPLVDIANVRLSFPSGCVANFTASRVSTEKVRKLRLFQPGEYISVDYQRQDALRLAVRNQVAPGSAPQIDGAPLPVQPGEPLTLELEAFFDSVRTRREPAVTAEQATDALRVAEQILAKIREHSQIVEATLRQRRLHSP